MYQLEGSIKLISPAQTFPSGFVKREFVVTTDDQYPQDIKLELTKEKCSLLDPISQGQRVSVSFRIRGNEYQGKYYVNLQAYKIDAGAGGGSSDGPGLSEPPPGHMDGPGNDPSAEESSPF
ncbi:MAG: DUF3127 domain-containing protein [Verrucomicrobiales bacterium]|nr:DUF3127 domain-containing protein [Verrucomicrobiales bacterium]